jgi:hypothetical protein
MKKVRTVAGKQSRMPLDVGIQAPGECVSFGLLFAKRNAQSTATVNPPACRFSAAWLPVNAGTHATQPSRCRAASVAGAAHGSSPNGTKEPAHGMSSGWTVKKNSEEAEGELT